MKKHNSTSNPSNKLAGLFELAALSDLIPPDFFINNAVNSLNSFCPQTISSFISFSKCEQPNRKRSAPSDVFSRENELGAASVPSHCNSQLSNNSPEISTLTNSLEACSGKNIPPNSSKSAPILSSSCEKQCINILVHKNPSNHSSLNCMKTVSSPNSSKKVLNGCSPKNGCNYLKLFKKVDSAKKVSNSKTLSSSNVSTTSLNSLPPPNIISKANHSEQSVNNALNVQNQTVTPIPPTPIKLHSCTFCGEKFKYNIALLDHLSSIHSQNLNSFSPQNSSRSLSTIKESVKTVKKVKSKKVKDNNKPISSKKKKRTNKVKKDKLKNSLSKANQMQSEDTSLCGSINSRSIDSTNIASFSSNGTTIKESNLKPISHISNNQEANAATVSSQHCSFKQVVVPDKSMSDLSLSTPSSHQSDDVSDVLLICLDDDSTSNELSNVDNPTVKDSSDKSNDSLTSEITKARSELAEISDIEDSSNLQCLTYSKRSFKMVTKFQCRLCKELFSRPERIFDHLEKCFILHKIKLKCELPDCIKISLGHDEYKEHLENEHKVEIYSCKHCKSFFNSTEALLKHNDNCKESFSSYYECPVEKCTLKFFYELHFRKHLSRRHNIIKSFICKVCKIFFFEENDLLQHNASNSHITNSLARIRNIRDS